jgi:U4/U6.U5 tri-snRNP-associated protein 2
MHPKFATFQVYLNLSALKFYCLPENYEIIDPSLEDIKVIINNLILFLAI